MAGQHFSDGRFKKIVRADVPGMTFIRKLRPVTYDVDIEAINAYYDALTKNIDLRPPMKLASKASVRQSGFIAQEVERAAAEAGYSFSGIDKPSNTNALYGLRYADFVVPVIKGIQEHDLIIENQRQRIEMLEARVLKMEASLKNIIGRD